MATAPIIDDRLAAARVAAIVVNYRTPDLAIACLNSLDAARHDLPGLRAIVVDGGSGDGSATRIAAGISDHGHGGWATPLPLPLNGGFGYANNQAILTLALAAEPPDFLFLVNPDARVHADAPARLARLLLDHPRAGAAGAALEGEDGQPQGAAFLFPTVRGEIVNGAGTGLIRRLLRQPEQAVAPVSATRVEWVTGAAVMLRAAALAEVGLFDDGFFLYFEEVELMHRIACAGWEIWHEPAARVVHIGGAATDVRWVDDGFHKRAPLPSFWYDSRRRYFARTSGRPAAAAAALGFVAGRALWLARCAIERRRDSFPLHMGRDTLRHALLPRRSDGSPKEVPRMGDAPGQAPAWMRA